MMERPQLFSSNSALLIVDVQNYCAVSSVNKA